ncbi:zinc-binding dehydrogenase [Chloroflexota bacterium]
MARKVRAMVLRAPGEMTVTEFDRPKIGPCDLLLRVEMVSICGGDPSAYKGEMYKVFPLILGHEVVGFVDEIGEQAVLRYGVQEGDRITVEPYIGCGICKYCLTGYYQLCRQQKTYGFNLSCAEPPHLWGAYSEFMFVASGSKVHKVLPRIPAEAACLSSVIGNGVRWVQDKGQVKFGESVVIVGAGAQGLSSVICAKEAGASPIIVLGLSRDELKFCLAREFGAEYVVNVEKEDAVSVVSEITNGEWADVVIQCSSSISGLATAIRLTKPLGRCILVGRLEGNGARDLSPVLRSFNRIVAREISLYGGMGQSWNVEEAMKLINARKYPIEKIVTHTFPLEAADKAMEFFISAPADCIRVGLVP